MRTHVVERRRIPGGRFSGELLNGAQISTGALHLIPHGRRGPLARALRELGIRQSIIQSDVLFSVWSPHRHVTCTRHHHLFTRVLAPREFPTATRMLFLLKRDRAFPGTVDEWLRVHRIHGLMVDLVRAGVDFALSVRLDQLPYRDFRAVVVSFYKLGGPGLPRGGSRALADQLLDHVEQAGATVRMHTEVTAVERHPDGQAWLVHCRDRDSGQLLEIRARDVVGTAGDDAPGPYAPARDARPLGDGPACGFKIQLLLPFSIVPHNGVMLCIGTRRLSGLAQVTNADRSLAPPGQHLVNTFHTCRADADPAVERREALRDVAAIAGRDIDDSWILSSAIYRGVWPVNRRTQGHEMSQQIAPGFLLAGDACKPTGAIMVEAAAQSAVEAARRLNDGRRAAPRGREPGP